jgi:hypothetical protein
MAGFLVAFAAALLAASQSSPTQQHKQIRARQGAQEDSWSKTMVVACVCMHLCFGERTKNRFGKE